MRKSMFCVTIAIVLCAGGNAYAQRRAPARGGHAVAVHRRAAPPHRVEPARRAAPPRRVARPRRAVTIRTRIAAPVFIGTRSYRRDRPPFYRPYARTSFGFGLSIGNPYGFYPYAYPAYTYRYAYPYSYSYAYPPVYPYAYGYPSYPGYPGYPGYPSYQGPVSVAPASHVSPGAYAPAAPSADEEVMPAPESSTLPELRGSVAIEGAPADATIYVDGNFAGQASAFTANRPLSEVAGYHEIEIRAPGHRTVIVHVDVQPDRTLTYTYDARPPLSEPRR